MSAKNWYNNYKKKKDKEKQGENIAPVVSSGGKHSGSGGSFAKNEADNKPTWFQGGAFSDGYQFGDINKTILGTAADVSENITTAVVDATENLIDTGAYVVGAVGGIFNEDFRDSVGDFIGKEILQPTKAGEVITKYANPAVGWLNQWINGGETEKISLLGDKADSLVQSASHLVGSKALERVGVPSWLTMGVNAFGSEIESAFQQDATYLEAGISGAVSAVAEVVFEKLSSGIKFKGGTLDDGLQKTLTKNISDRITRTVLKWATDLGGEGLEEVATEAVSAVGKKLTYMDEKEFNEIFSSEDAFDAFIGGVVMAGAADGVNTVKSAANGTDIASGLTVNEEKVVRKLYEDALAEKQKEGTELNKAERDKLWDSIVDDMSKGQIKIDDIESVLGGDTYKTYTDTTKKNADLKAELNKLSNMKKGDMTRVQEKRLEELEAMNLDDDTEISKLKSKLSQEVFGIVQSDKTGRLAESYKEVARRREAFKADLTKYKGKQKEAVQRAIDSGVLNNTYRSHELVNILSKIEADKGIVFNYADNAKLKESGFVVEGKTVNGFVDNNTGAVTLNIQSAKSWQSVVGHEITHVLEGTEAYDALQKALYAYAESKGELADRRGAITELYKGMNADIDSELTADLIGDYLFTDKDFVTHLTTDRNLFQKIYDEIKYLYKVATGKEQKEIAKVKKEFDKAWKELNVKPSESGQKNNTAENSGVRYSFGENSKTKDVFGFAIDENAIVDEDLLEEISAYHPEAEVDREGNVTVYHRTMEDAAKKIKETGVMKSKEDALFFSSKESGYATDYGESVVKLKIPSTMLRLNDVFDGEVHFDLPLKYKNGEYSLDVSKYLVNDMRVSFDEGNLRYLNHDLNEVLESFGIVKNNDYIHVQKQVFDTLKSEGFFEDADNNRTVVINTNSGMEIEINRKGISETFNDKNYNRISKELKHIKLLVIRDIDKVIKTARLAEDDVNNFHNVNNGVKYAYLENVVNIDGKNRVISIAVRKSKQKNMFWVHQIDVKKDTQSLSAGVNHSKTDYLTSGANNRLAQDGGDVKKNSISNEADDIAPVGDFSTPLNELYYEDIGPVRKDIAPAKTAVDTNVGGKQTVSDNDDIAPVVANNAITASVQTVEQRVADNLKAVEDELQDAIQMRKDVEYYYNQQIYSVKKKIDYYKNQNIIWSPDKNQSIPELEKLKAKTVESLSAKISELEKKAKYMKTKAYSRALHKQAKMQEHAQWAEELIGDTTTWVDKKLGLQYQTNTERRNLRDIVRDENGNKDIARADAISDALHGRYNREEAAKKREQARFVKKYAAMKITKAESTYIQMLGELRYNPKTSLSEKDVNAFYENHKNKIDPKKVDKAISYARSDFDELFSRLNEKLREQGMKEIPYRKGYFPHFTNPKQNVIEKLLNWKTQNNEIPTSIAGLTESFRPVKKYQTFDKKRHTDKTDYNFLQGFDNYLDGALDWIYHLDTLQKRRAVENYIRYIHSDQGIQARIREIYANEEFDADEAQAQVDHIFAEGKNPLNNFVQDFTTRTNILAGKKNSLDRTIEQATNRHIYSVMTNVQNRMSANMVLANIRSAMTNFIPITQSWAQVSPFYSLQATKDTIANAIKDDGMIEKSTFLTNRLREVDRLYQTNWDKVLDKAGVMFEIVDNFSSQVIWRSKYNQNIKKGMTESEAIRNADQFAENVMAGRSKGNEPTLFNAKNPLVKAFTMFQLEVNNQYGYLFKDVPIDLKAETKHWKLNLAKGYTTAFVGAFVYNVLMEMITGSDAALDPLGIIWELLKDLGVRDEDEKKEPDEIAINLIDNVVEELPFVGGLFGGGRVPISSAMPYSDEYDNGLSGFISDVSEGEWGNVGKEMLNPLLNVVLPVGGGQIKKTAQGLRMFKTDEEHPIAGSYTDKGNLRFPVEDTPINRIQAGLFGQYANENAREYFDNGYAPLDEKQIQEYENVELPIADYWKYLEGLKGLKTNAEKADYINSLDIEDWQKNLLMNNKLDREEDIDMSNYNDYSGWEEFDFATKNPEKYGFLQANNISYAEYNASEESKEAYNWAFENPEKHIVSKVISDNVVTYRKYTSELNDIKADKDENGKSISGSRKDKVIDYINNLDADYEAKIILFKKEYPAENAYNEEIVNYINNREDLSYEERVTIFKELGFKVSNDSVYWD